MDVERQTRRPDLSSPDALAAHVRVLSDRIAIGDLAALYAMAVDDHDIEGVLTCFAPHGSFTRAGVTSRGTQELRAFYVSMMDRYRTMLHTIHSHVVAVDGDRATGLLTGHAELGFEGTLMMTAYRYDDDYVCQDGRWVFADRRLRSMYVVPVDAMASSFADTDRIRWPGTDPRAADFPESAPTWATYAVTTPDP